MCPSKLLIHPKVKLNSSGDAMPQALNLIQMFMNRANPSADAIKGAEKKPSSESKQGNDALLGNNGASKESSFQSKVRASQAQLSAKNAKLKAESHSIDTIGAKPVTKNKSPESAEKSSRGQNAKENIKNQSHDQREKAVSTKREDRAQKPEITKSNSNTDQNSQKMGNASATGAKGSQDSQSAAQEAETALQDRLEKLGVNVTSEQINDPVFLNEMLQYLQSMSATESADFELAEGAESGDSLSIDVIGSEENNPVNGSATLVGKDGKTADSEGNAPGSQEVAAKDLAELVKNRLAEIAQGSKAGAGTEANSGNENWKSLRVGAGEANLASDPISKSELDRLRVMQASSLQVGSNGGVGEFDVEGLAEEANDNLEINAAHNGKIDESEKPAGDSSDTDAPGNKQEQGQAQGSGMVSRTDGTQILKDGSNGVHFNQSLEQARSAEAKVSAERVWAPQRSAFDQNILQQISKKLNGSARLNGEEISIQLEPENLGKIKVGIGLKDGVMNARIGVENESVRQIVEANIANLKETLENQGVKLGSLEVNIEQRQGSLFNPDGSNSESFFHQRGRGNNGAGSDAEGKSGLVSAPESETGRRWGYNTMEYIG
jgi:flagellar hook-length control protein FliK